MIDWINEELGLDVVACQHWRWMPGMKIYIGDAGPIGMLRVIATGQSGVPITRNGFGQMTTWSTATIPDLTDAATLGCLLALVREAWEPRRGDDPILCTHQTLDGKWGVGSWVSAVFAAVNLPTYPTEAEALVAALEASDEQSFKSKDNNA